MTILRLSLLAAFSCAAVFGSSVGYTDEGTIASTYTFTATYTGAEIAYFYGSTALYHNMIGVWGDGVQLGSFALNNHTSTFGESYDFGDVTAGETIVFALEVLTKGYTIYSDPSMNSDGANHVYTTPFLGDPAKGITLAPGTFVSFEDLLLPHSNLNYNDEDVIFSNITATAVTPEPGSLFLLGAGCLSMAILASRRKLRTNV